MLIWIAGCFWLPVLDGHRNGNGPRHPLTAIGQVLGDANQRRSMLFSACVIFSGFTVIPYLTVYSIGNAGVLASQIPVIYLIGGLVTLFTARLIGRWADRVGKLKAFRWLALAAIAPILALTHVQDVGLAGWLPGSIAFFVLVSGRMIPAMALLSSAVDPARRGAAMSLNVGGYVAAWQPQSMRDFAPRTLRNARDRDPSLPGVRRAAAVGRSAGRPQARVTPSQAETEG